MNDELRTLWLNQPLSPNPNITDAQRLILNMEKKAQQFSREIRTRNRHETLAAALGAPYFLGMAWVSAALWNSPLLAWSNALAALTGVWVIFYLHRYGRLQQLPAPEQSLQAYRTALRENYDRQIQLLRQAKYWYILPIYISLLLMYAGHWELTMRHHPGPPPSGAQWVIPVLLTVLAGYVWWLNEVRAVRDLRQKQAELVDEHTLNPLR